MKNFINRALSYLCPAFQVRVYHNLPFKTIVPRSRKIMILRKSPMNTECTICFTYSIPQQTSFLELTLAGWHPLPSSISSPPLLVSFLPVWIKKYFPWLTKLWPSITQRRIITILTNLTLNKRFMASGLRFVSSYIIYEQALQSSCELLIRQIEWLELHAILKPWKTFGSLSWISTWVTDRDKNCSVIECFYWIEYSIYWIESIFQSVYTNMHAFTLIHIRLHLAILLVLKWILSWILMIMLLSHVFGAFLTIQTIHYTWLTLHICALVIWLFTYTDRTRPIFQEKNTFLEKKNRVSATELLGHLHTGGCVGNQL